MSVPAFYDFDGLSDAKLFEFLKRNYISHMRGDMNGTSACGIASWYVDGCLDEIRERMERVGYSYSGPRGREYDFYKPGPADNFMED